MKAHKQLTARLALIAAIIVIALAVYGYQMMTMLVPGMERYDSSFGYAFWHPYDWHVLRVNVDAPDAYPGGNVVGQLFLIKGARSIKLEEYETPTDSITDATGVGACPVCVSVHYFYDMKSRSWMVEGLSAPKPETGYSTTMGG